MNQTNDTPQDTTPHPWSGERITSRLQLWRSEDHPGMWDVHGKDYYVAALATEEDLVRLAHVILQHFGDKTDLTPRDQPSTAAHLPL